VKWEVTGTKREVNGDVPIITKQLVGHVDNSSYPLITVDIQLTLTTPANATRPVPVIMEFGFGFGGPFGGRGFGGAGGPGRRMAPPFGGGSGPRGSSKSWPKAGATPSSLPTAFRRTTAPA
jgi:hypothetical protein